MSASWLMLNCTVAKAYSPMSTRISSVAAYTDVDMLDIKVEGSAKD